MATNHKHPLVSIIHTDRTGFQARYKEHGKLKQVTLHKLGLRTNAQRISFAIELSDKLCSERRSRLLGVPQTVLISLEEAVGQRLEALAKTTRAQTVKNHRNAYKHFQAWFKNGLSDLMDSDLVAFRDHLDSLNQAHNTLHMRRVQIGSLLHYCRDRHYCTKLSEHAIKQFTKTPNLRDVPSPDILTPDQVRKASAWMAENEPHIFPLFQLLLCSGMRITEALTMDFSKDVRPDCITVRPENCKTKVQRDITFDVAPSLQTLVRCFTGQHFKTSRMQWNRAIQRARKALGFTFTAHTLRRTHASVLLNGGLLTPLQAARRMGHTITVMDKSYLNLIRSSELEKDASTLEAALSI